ncbi:hypothetical protein ACMA1I_08875 [Pontibacter sp. 13R65]|uniref:hypothetical protein n=1 Tax=Pontibacter sp. 13R65 TaxID=3127458 RepID=UPI00301BADB4
MKQFVRQVEDDLQTDLEDTTKIWEDEANRLKEEYHQLEDVVDNYIQHYPPQQRETIQDYKERFSIALSQKQKKYDDAQARYRLRQDLLGVEVVSEDLDRILPDNITATYQKFVNTVVQNKEVYTPRDWELIQGWWTALNTRKSQLQDQLRPADELAIAQKQSEFQELIKTQNIASPKPAI